MTPTRERYVATKIIQSWLDEGLTADQIALRWNSGQTKTCSSGVNKWGVKYDSCAYVSKVIAMLNQGLSLVITQRRSLTRGASLCYIKMNKGNYRHGMKGTRPYRAWRNMKDRCLNPKNKHWADYGGRGIKVCKEWLSFEGFWNDMQWTYEEELTLDRRDNNYHYCKSNCRWATLMEQAANKRNNVAVYKGETARQAGLRINGNPSLVYQRLNAGWSIEQAFTKLSRRPRH